MNPSHHNYHMYTVQLNLFQFSPTVIIQTCGFIFDRKLTHSLHCAALFPSTKTTHALASQFTSLLNLYLILPFKKDELTEKENNSSLESSTVASRSRCTVLDNTAFNSTQLLLLLLVTWTRFSCGEHLRVKMKDS